MTTADPKFPFRWLYGVRIAFMIVSLGTSVWGLYNYVEFMAKYGFEYWDAEDFLHLALTCAFLAYYGLQILAGIFYLRSKALGFILSINIIGLILQALEIATLIDVITIWMTSSSTPMAWRTSTGFYIHRRSSRASSFIVMVSTRIFTPPGRMSTVWTQEHSANRTVSVCTASESAGSSM